ncbi:MAG: hypothetical protein JST85_29050 [Acidobacteria bacterium]|nr:hypothetical protein [Acidobacteriota bacterium]
MKKQTIYGIALSFLFLLFGGLKVSAQSTEYLMTVQVPFDFQVNGKVLPAGQYTVKRNQQMPTLLLIQSSERGIYLFTQITSLDGTEKRSKSSLVFKEYDQQHFLSEVRFPGTGSRFVLSESKAERKLAQAAGAGAQ